MFDYFSVHRDAWEEYNRTVKDKGFSYGVQKERLLVKISVKATHYDIDAIGAGIMYFLEYDSYRNYFKNDLTLLFDTRDMNEVAQSNLDILVIFLIIVAIIAITLAFFLLLLSNISNIRENVWEFGILRYEE